MRSALSLLVTLSVMGLVAAVIPSDIIICRYGNPVRVLDGTSRDTGRMPCPGEDGTFRSRFYSIPPPLVDPSCHCVPFYQCQVQHIVNDRLVFLLKFVVALKVVATMQRASGAAFQGVCDPGTYRIRGRCEEVFGGFDYKRPAVKVQCDCVAFYLCRYQDVMNMKIKSCGATEVCCRRGKPEEEECGWSAGGVEGAAEARYGEFPWMVAILNVSAGGTWKREEYVGGGALIHPRVVLTAAHKVEVKGKLKAAEMLKCRAGERSRTEPSPQAQERRVADLHQHPKYERRYTANDVTLLRLIEPFDMSLGAVRSLCVGRGPPPRADLCVTMGWGQHQFNNSDHADTLKKVAAPLVTRDICWRALQAVDAKRQRMVHAERQRAVKAERHPALPLRVQDALEAERRRSERWEPAERPELHPSLLCAGGLRGQDTCTGDGGSPLVCQLEKVNATRVRFAVYGLVAWGVGCGERGAPGVYVDVAKLHDWIITTVKIIIV